MSQAGDLSIPESDPRGFAEWVRTEYVDNRWSRVEVLDDGVVTVWGGENPAFRRFQWDLVPRLFEHGLVVEHVQQEALYADSDGGGVEHVPRIVAVPIVRVVAHMEGLFCDRQACDQLIDDAGVDYCATCGRFLGDE